MGTHVDNDGKVTHFDGLASTLTTERKRFLHDIFVTAIEGGITYWASVEEYHWHAGNAENALDNLDLDGFFAQIIEEDAADDGKAHRIDINVIHRGIERILAAKAPYYDPNGARTQCESIPGLDRGTAAIVRQANHELDAGDIDAGIADAIVQAGLFEEIVYG